jgi:predicted HTH domain antitoxin
MLHFDRSNGYAYNGNRNSFSTREWWMTLVAETVTLQDVLSLARFLSAEDRQRLVTLLNWREDMPLPEQTTREEAITFYLADLCSLGRAAELAGVTRWHIIDVFKERDIPILIYGDKTVEEIDALAEQLEHEGYL